MDQSCLDIARYPKRDLGYRRTLPAQSRRDYLLLCGIRDIDSFRNANFPRRRSRVVLAKGFRVRGVTPHRQLRAAGRGRRAAAAAIAAKVY
jgi:hypothetical protein